MTTTSRKRPASRQEALRDSLPLTADLLKRRQACDIPAGYIDDYLALDWLEWMGGTLRLTTTGQNICRNVVASHRR
ncbi:hypothetical protein [uncultured Azohydromonas sp.]|jgi:hypothetical protein|uniref:hypothetical protein n=1 Tax=uncultured Azohydromonas sp. TaxID=487342 RepID=UPI00261B05EC|nr:hypothetical protein [uncultured Azohydromonas sp.]